MFNRGDSVFVMIPVNGQQIAVPGICKNDEYEGIRRTRDGSPVPASFVDVISYHEIPAEAAKKTPGQAFAYYKVQRQSAFFMTLRSTEVEALDTFTEAELEAKCEESRLAAVERVTPKTGPSDSARNRFNTPLLAQVV